MKTNELRIGNFVDYLGSYKVIDVINGSHGIVEFDDGAFERNINLIKPIPLSEEILLKFDFIKDDNLLFRTKNGIRLEFYFYKSSEIEVYLDSNPLNIKYVHQLQNLYFCLCGEELEIKI